jgi:hemoglobin/transferrin/lactoferrin receptor protein
MPGVTTQETARDTAQAINVRGLQDFGRVNVLIDGMRQNFQRSGHNANGAFYIEPEMVKGVDVTRGPTATIYGSGAIGGVVQFDVIDADDILRPGETVAGRLKTRWSTNGEGPFGSATAAMRGGNFDMVGQLNGRDVGDYKDGNGVSIQNSGEETVSGLARARWRPAPGHQITGTFIDYNSMFIDSTVTGSTPRDSELHNRQMNLGYTFMRPDTPLFNLSTKVYRNETDLLQTKLTAPSLGSVRGFNVVTEGADISNVSRFHWGATKLAVTVGGDIFRDSVTTFDPAGNGDELTPGGQRQVAGAFTQAHLSFWETIDVIGAIRYDTYQLEGGTTELDGSRASPKLTLGYTPIKGMTLFGTYAEGFRAPAVTEKLIFGFHPAPAAFRLLPNPDLRPEVAHNLEAGVNFKYDDVFSKGDKFRAKATVFQNKVDDYIGGVFSPTPLPNGQYQYQNIAQAELEGVELEAAYDARRWFIGVAAHHIEGTDLTSGQPLLTIPADQLTLTAGVRLLDERLVLGARARFVAAQDRVPTGATPASEYVVADIFAQYNHSDDLAFNLNIDNVFDKAYTQYLDQSASPGLNVRLGMTMRFGAQ